MDQENDKLHTMLDSEETEVLSMRVALEESKRAHQDYKILQQKFLKLEENTTKNFIVQKNEIKRLQEVAKEKEDQLKGLKEKCVEYKHKKSLHEYLDHQRKGIVPEEKKSFTRKSH